MNLNLIPAILMYIAFILDVGLAIRDNNPFWLIAGACFFISGTIFLLVPSKRINS